LCKQERNTTGVSAAATPQYILAPDVEGEFDTTGIVAPILHLTVRFLSEAWISVISAVACCLQDCRCTEEKSIQEQITEWIAAEEEEVEAEWYDNDYDIPDCNF
jgi:hypothetical protein